MYIWMFVEPFVTLVRTMSAKGTLTAAATSVRKAKASNVSNGIAQTSVTPTNEPLGTAVGAFVTLGMGVVVFVPLFVPLFVALFWRKLNLWIQAL